MQHATPRTYATSHARTAWLVTGLALAALTLVALVPGCFVEDESPLPADFGECATPPEEPVIDQLLTYYQDVKPIIDARCANCHRDGDIGPFPLVDYDQVYAAREVMRSAVDTGVMPPWQPDDCCNTYRWDRSLSIDERAALIAWIDQGALPGDENQPAPPLPGDQGGLSRVDLSLSMAEPFTPEPMIGRDEIRCFLLDWPYDEEMYVTGLDVRPGERRVVHHVIVYTVDQESVPSLRARDGADGRPGWDCYGAFGGEERPTGSIGGWAPGYRGVEFPDSLGRKVPAGSALVLNMHYDTGRGIYEDQTTVDLMVAESVDGELESMGVVNPLWLVDDGMAIAANDPDAWAFFAYDPGVFFAGGEPFQVYAVNLHMHELGSVGRLAVLRADGTTECLLDIERWDFDWIGDYYFAQPVEIRPGDRIYLECHWDNTASNQKIVDGERETPRDIAWGTDQEMCAAVLTVRK